MLAQQLAHIDFLDESIERVSGEIAERLRPFDQTLLNLDAIPGVGRRTAEILLAEIGTDMSRFPSAAHLASWAGMCPGHDESAGKRRSGKTRKGSPALRHALTEAARAAARSKNTYLAAQFHRLAARRGSKRAAVAVGHSILIIVWHQLAHGHPYQDLGGNYFEIRAEPALTRHLVRRLKALGYDVQLQPRAA
jgi:transposase